MLSVCHGRGFQHKPACSFLWRETTQSLLQRRRREKPIQRWPRGKAPTFSSLSTVVCRSATLFSYFLCTLAKTPSIFFCSCKHETEAVRGEGGLEPLRGAFTGLYRGSLWGECDLKCMYVYIYLYFYTFFITKKYILKDYIFRNRVEMCHFMIKYMSGQLMKPQVWNRHTRLLSDPLLRCSELLLDVLLQLRQLTGVHFLGSTWTEKIKHIFWLGRQEQKYHPYMSNWQGRLSCAAGLRALVRQVPDQPQVREGQASKKQQTLPLSFTCF